MELKHKVIKELEGTYYYIPFDVPENVIKLTVSYDYFRPTKGMFSDLKPTNCIDIGLSDSDGRFLGWSGSAHSSVSVGEYSSSSGYLCEKIKAGKWQIIVGAYHVLPEGVEVTYKIDFEYAGEKLLYGDLHIHSDASDGKYDAFEIGKKAKNKGLDFVALANHNNYALNFHLPHINGLTFIPTVEWTHYKGHMNFFGVNAPFDNSFIANDAGEMKKLIADARNQGAVISVNHPKCRFCPYLWEDESAFDMMEIWNGPMRPTNVDGIAYWTELLKKGRKIPIVGGSDYHSPKGFARIGNPVTAVYSASPSSADILDAITHGHGFVAFGKEAPVIDLHYGEFRMGDTAQADGSFLEITVENAKDPDVILVTDREEKKIGQNRIKISDEKFAYIKIVKHNGRKILAVSNPIYFTKG
ncbi:MAG: CehA/McbA family metallohydrolase [Clostridia bacterium]|nr:CehA/McbA family metallohydrolase [Clostridia bacterium]